MKGLTPREEGEGGEIPIAAKRRKKHKNGWEKQRDIMGVSFLAFVILCEFPVLPS
jgi:hypothetical protein